MVFTEEQVEARADAQSLVEGMWKEIVQHLIAEELFQWFSLMPIGSCGWQAPWDIAKAIVALNDVWPLAEQRECMLFELLQF